VSLTRPRHLIPAIAGIGALMPACADPLIGDWEVTKLHGDVLPKSYTDQGTTYTKSASLAFEEDGEVEFTKTKTWTGTKTGTKSYVYTGSWAAQGSAEYLITIDGEALDCTLSDELECDDAQGDRALEAKPAE